MVKHFKEKKLFSIGKIFFSGVQVPEHKFEKFGVKI
jgi:hypothetical protein